MRWLAFNQPTIETHIDLVSYTRSAAHKHFPAASELHADLKAETIIPAIAPAIINILGLSNGTP